MGPGSYNDRHTAAYTAYTNDTGVECSNDDMVWFSPACRANTTLCVPLLLQYNYQVTMQLAFWLRMPVAIVKVQDGSQAFDDAYYRAVRSGSFIFDWFNPDDSLMDPQGRAPVLITMPPANLFEQSQLLYRTGYPLMNPRNFFWNRLPAVDPFVTYLASNVNFYDHDVAAMMLRSRHLKDAGADPAAVPWAVACEWLTANRERWLPWIPADCSPAHYVDTALSSCLPCPAGAYCPGGYSPPAPCPAGSFCPADASAPVPCPDGRSTAGAGASAEGDCAACPDGVLFGRRCVPGRVALPAIVLPAAALLALAAVCWRRLRVVTSRRLLGAAVGALAEQGDLPYELRRKYEAVRVVGRGAFGVVIEAWQLTNGRRNIRRAVKLMCAAAVSPARTISRKLTPPPSPPPTLVPTRASESTLP